MVEMMAILFGAFGAAMIAGTAYLNARKAGESFDPFKFAQTVILGAFVGGVMGFSGIAVSAGTVEVQMTSYAFLGGGITIFLENIAKIFYRKPTTTTITTATVVTPAIIPVKRPGFVLPRDGSKLMDAADGFWIRMAFDTRDNTRDTVPDDQNYQLMSPDGKYATIGDKDEIIYLGNSSEAAGYRANYKKMMDPV